MSLSPPLRISYPELAAVLGVSVRTLGRWVRTKRVEAPSLGRSWSAEGGVVVARAHRVPVPDAWVQALTPAQRALIGWVEPPTVAA